MLLLLFLVTMSACSPRNPRAGKVPRPYPLPHLRPNPQRLWKKRRIPQPSTISLVAVGDNLIHDAIYNQASRRAGGDGYDFSFAYEQVAPLIAGH